MLCERKCCFEREWTEDVRKPNNEEGSKDAVSLVFSLEALAKSRAFTLQYFWAR